MNITLLNNLTLVAVIQGFIFVVFVLASKKFKAQSTLFLVAMIFALSYNNLQYFFTNTNLITAYTLYKTFYLPMGVLIPPLWYFYVTIFLNPEKKIKSKDWLMFLPFLLFFTINSVYKILILMNVDIRGYIQFFDITLFIHEVSTLLFMFTVLVILTTKIIKFKKKATSFNYDKVIPATSWLLWIIIIAFINMAIYAAFIINLYYD